MAKNITERIESAAFKLLAENPEGLRYSELTSLISVMDAKFNANTIGARIWGLDTRFPERVYKPSRGLFRLREFKDTDSDDLREEAQPKELVKVKEEDFYKPFSDWLQNDIEDVTLSIPLGKNCFKDKWGTPDVIGKRESRRSDIIQAPLEIVSAEIKTETGQLITAFGQACAYKLFSHRCYLVVPKLSPPEEIARLDSLCQLFGIGLVLFDASKPANPGFVIRVRPTKSDPDLYYTNKYMARIEKDLFS